jgi:DNA-binding beta-propeller fold protein YncE
MKLKSTIYLFALSLLFTACTKTENKPDEPVDYGKYGLGVLISNEGTFGSGNGSISYYDSSKDSVTNEIFQLENNRNLGDVVQSVNRIGDNVFIQVNNSNKIEVVDGKSFAEMGVIQNLTQVRYAVGDENNAYASAWGAWGSDGKVYIIDLSTLTVSDSVETGLGPEQMILLGDKLFVANSGGWGYDNSVSVISTSGLVRLLNIEVGANPKSMVLDNDNNLWVLCSGSALYDANWNITGHNPSKLVQINTEDYSVIKEVPLFSDQHPAKLAINPEGDELYIGAGFGFNGIYTHKIADASFTENLLIDKAFYGFDVNPNDGVIFAYEALNFTESGKLYRYDNKNGIELNNYLVGIAPNGSSLKRNK